METVVRYLVGIIAGLIIGAVTVCLALLALTAVAVFVVIVLAICGVPIGG